MGVKRYRIHLKAQSKAYRKVMSLRGRIAKAAQRVYDRWDPEDDWYGGGGICDDVASEMSNVLSMAGFDTMEGGHPGDDHASVIVYTDDEAFSVDIPARVYESGGGFRWEKIEGVRISSGDVYVDEVDRRYI